MMKKYLGYIYLLLGLIAMTLSNGVYLNGYAALIFPLLLLMAIDNMRPIKAFILVTLGAGVANMISFYNVVPDIGIPIIKWMPVFAGSTYGMIFLLQNFYFKRTDSFSATLILPSLYALLDFANAYFNPFGTFGVLGYSQHNILPIAQLASVVGTIGLTFMIVWFGSVIYWMIKHNKFRSFNRYNIGAAIVIIAILTFGILRLLMVDKTNMVRISGLHTLDRSIQETANLFTNFESNPDAFQERSLDNVRRIMELTRKEAKEGAEIVNHAEATIVISFDQKDTILNQLKKLADEQDITLVTTLYILHEPSQNHENVLYIIGDDGDILLHHYKYGGNSFEGTVKGDGILQAVNTENGTLSGIICWDKDFPYVVDQIGSLDVDTLFIPSADWKEISPYHTIVGNFRGIEHGTNVVTQTVNGMSMIADYTGRVIKEMDHFKNDEWIIRGQLPVHGVKTLYSSIEKYIIIFIFMALIYAQFSLLRKKNYNKE